MKPTISELLNEPEAVLHRSDLAQLGYERRAIDAIFRACALKTGVQAYDGYSRPMIRVKDFLELREERTFRGDRVRPT